MNNWSASILFFAMLCSCFAWNQHAALSQPVISPDSVKGDYDAEIKLWRTQDEERLRAPFGWLALTGHYWLTEGANEFDSQAGPNPKAIVLPSNLSEQIKGVFVVKGTVVELSLPENSPVTVNGKSEREVTLDIDGTKEEADGKDKIAIADRIQLQLVKRNGRFAVRVRDSESPTRAQFTGKKWYDVDKSYRVQASFTPYLPPRDVSIVNIKGESVRSKVVGSLSFTINDRTFSLDALSETPDRLFVLFKDLTNGDTTYEAGRFLYASLPVDGVVTLDFNKAYNPPCAFSSHTLCPVPPKQNHLSIEIRAGERKYQIPEPK
ncbi:MAG: DUF1684 domain-containing protein [Pirellula sp.]|nr:DUF1684 domain-containing protein [Pirellula sp.]